MEEEEKKDDTVVATQNSPTDVQDVTEVMYQAFLSTWPEFIPQARTTSEAWLVEKVITHTPKAITHIVRSQPEEVGFKGNKPFLIFFRRIPHNGMILSRSMAEFETAAKDAVII